MRPVEPLSDAAGSRQPTAVPELIGADAEAVTLWLHPLGLNDLVVELRRTGFSGEVYRRSFADLNANLADEAAGTLHFLRYGYGERRIFPVELDLAGLTSLRQLGVHNHIYLQNLFVALVTAWIGTNVRSTRDLATHGPTIEGFRKLGALPLLILGDSFAGLYSRGVCKSTQWICPLALTPLEGGIDKLLRTAPRALLAARSDLDDGMMPVLWKFGQHDVEHGYLVHRRRCGISLGDMDAFREFAMQTISRYLEFLATTISSEERALHWIACLLPPTWHAADRGSAQRGLMLEFRTDLLEWLIVEGVDSLLDRTLMHQYFNERLEQAATELGFNVLRNFDCFLTPHGIVEEQYIAVPGDPLELNYQAMHGVISTLLWTVVEDRRGRELSASLGDQFEQLLQEIRLVRLAEPE